MRSRNFMKKAWLTAGIALASVAMAVTSTTAAHASVAIVPAETLSVADNGFIAGTCHYGHPCVGDGVDQVYNGRCDFQNFELETDGTWDQDSATNWKTHGNRMQLGNYKGSGSLSSLDSYVWSDHFQAWTSGQLGSHGWDAMYVYC